MKSITTILLISLVFFQYSCMSNMSKEYEIGQHKLIIEVPNSFEEINIDEAEKFLEEGIELFEQNGYTEFDDQEALFFFQKGEFSLMKGKKYELKQNINGDYKSQWNNMKAVLFDVLKKKTLEMDGATIDSISKIEKINGIEFYVFETNIYLRDLNNTKTNLKSLRYSTLIENQDLVIDASFVDQNDSIEIKKSIKSIQILK